MLSEEDAKLLASFITNFIFAVVFLVLFIFFRSKIPQFYEPKCNGSVGAPVTVSTPWFGWVRDTFQVTDNELFLTHGLDVYIFLRFLRLLLIVSVIQFAFGTLILSPVYFSGHVSKIGNTTITGLSNFSIVTLRPGSLRHLAPLISVIVNTVAVMILSYKTYSGFAAFRRKHLCQSRAENFTNMMTEIPLHIIGEDMLRKRIDRVLQYPGIVAINIVHPTKEIDDKFKQRAKIIKNLQRVHAIFETTGRREIARRSLFGRTTDAMYYYEEQHERICNEIVQLQASNRGSTGVAFLTFKSIRSAMSCAQAVIESANEFVTGPTFDPKSIIWSNLNVDGLARLIRSWLVNIFIFLLVFFWMIPVGFVSALSNLQTLATIPGFGFIVDIVEFHAGVSAFVQGFLPTLVFIIFFAFLVKIITALSRWQGLSSEILVDRSVLSKYFVFQVVNVFLGVSIGSMLLNNYEDIIDDPFGSIVDVAKSLPSQSGFFISYIMVLSLGGASLELLRPIGLLKRWILHKFYCKTKEEYEEAQEAGSFLFGVPSADHLLVFMVVTVYSTTNPFISMWGVVYFGLAMLSTRYNLKYVYSPDFEGGGHVWPSIFNRICFSVLLYQFVMITTFSAYEFFFGSSVTAMCMLCTMIFWVETNRRFHRECTSGTMTEVLNSENSNTASLNNFMVDPNDRANSPQQKGEVRATEFSAKFKQPSMCPPEFKIAYEAC